MECEIVHEFKVLHWGETILQEGPEGYSGQALRECAYVEECVQKETGEETNR